MYSMVLMAALTTGTDMPDWGRRGWGCCGCYGGYAWGGYGRGWGGGYGWGGWGGGYGGWGGWGGWGGGWGGWGYVAAPMIPSYAAPVLIASAPLTESALTRSMYYDPGSTARANRATIIVHLPAKAKLIVDGKPTTSTSTTRRFVSPPLEKGHSYHYVFKAEMDREGQTVATTKRVDVTAGNTEEIYLKLPALNESSERSHAPTKPAERRGVPARTDVLDQP